MSQMIVNGDKFALLRGAQRVWTVASVHGESDRLWQLHRQISERFQPGDRLVYLGNILGYGSDAAAAVDEVLAFRRAVIATHGMFAADVVVLRGAQEEMWQKLLQLQLALNPGEVFDWMIAQGVGATLEAYGGQIDEGRDASRSVLRFALAGQRVYAIRYTPGRGIVRLCPRCAGRRLACRRMVSRHFCLFMPESTINVLWKLKRIVSGGHRVS